MNIAVEKALYDFGKRSHVEDIISFAEVLPLQNGQEEIL